MGSLHASWRQEGASTGQMDKPTPKQEQEAGVWELLAKKSWKQSKADCTVQPLKEGPTTSEGRLLSPQSQPKRFLSGGWEVGRLA